MKPCIFIECSAPFWLTVAREIQDEQGYQPVYWTGLTHYADELLGAFPNLVFHDCVEAKFGIPRIDADDLPAVTVDDMFLDIWHEESQLVYDMLNRFDLGRDFSFAERRRHFRRVLEYWMAVLKRFQPELLVFPNPPHVTYDYVVYCLAKRLAIPTVMWDETAISDRFKFILPMTRFEEGSVRLREHYRDKLSVGSSDAVQLRPNVQEYLDGVRADYTRAQPVNERNVARDLAARETEESRENDRTYLKTVCQRDLDVHRGFATPSMDWLTSCWKQVGLPFESSFSSPFAWTEFEFTQRWWWRQAERRREFYDELATVEEPRAPYVYVALAGQPERTSNPQGGVFTDQFLLVHMLAKTVPEGWSVYVKEHPNQFNPYFHGHTCREPEFYSDIVELPNVHLVARGAVPFDLIDGAMVVATIAGTTSWEAVVRGIPSLVFGAAWYRDCEGVFSVRTERDCRETLAHIESGYRVDPSKVDMYVKAVQEIAVEGLSDPLPAEWTDLTAEENGKRLARSILALLGTPAGSGVSPAPSPS